MALIPNLPIFVQNGGHFVCYHGNGGLAEKSLKYFLLGMTHSTNWPEKMSLTMQKKISKWWPFCLLSWKRGLAEKS